MFLITFFRIGSMLGNKLKCMKQEFEAKPLNDI